VCNIGSRLSTRHNYGHSDLGAERDSTAILRCRHVGRELEAVSTQNASENRDGFELCHVLTEAQPWSNVESWVDVGIEFLEHFCAADWILLNPAFQKDFVRAFPISRVTIHANDGVRNSVSWLELDA